MPPPSALAPAISETQEVSGPTELGRVPLWKPAAILVLGMLVALFFWLKPHPIIPSRSGVVMHLPSYVNAAGGFVGLTAPVSLPELTILPKDTEFARKEYDDLPAHDHIFCGIVLSGATQQSIHRPEVCLVGQGWSITDQEVVPIRLPSGHLLRVKNLTIKKTLIGNDNRPFTLTSYNMYWFVGENITTPYHSMRVFLSSWDRIMHNRAHRWAYVTVSSPITAGLLPDGKNAAQTKAMMIEFIKTIVPTFQKNEMSSSAETGTVNSSRAPS